MTGKITKLEVQKNNKDRINVFIDFEYKFACDAELIYKYNLKTDSIIDLNNVKSIIDADNYIKAKNTALKFIERSYKTYKQVMDKLLQKGYDEVTAHKVLEFMISYKFVDDEKFARAYINEKYESVGKNKIIYELNKRGISEDIVNEIFNSMNDKSQEEGAYILVKKKYNILIKKETDLRKLYQKLSRYLMGKGYNWDVAKSVVDRIIKADEIE